MCIRDSPNAVIEAPVAESAVESTAEEEESEEEESEEDEGEKAAGAATASLLQLKVDALERFNIIKALHAKMQKACLLYTSRCV